MSKSFAVVFIYILILFLLYLLVFNFSFKFINKISVFIKDIPNLLDQIFEIININDTDIKNKIISYLSSFISNINIKLPDTCFSLFSSISSILIGLVISFYMLLEEINLSKYFKPRTYKLINNISVILKNYIKAILISSFVVFILSFIVFVIFKIPNAFIYGLLCGITNIIPYIGPYIGGVIPSIIAFGISVKTGVLVVISIVLVQLIEGNIIHPIIMSKSINIHPVVSIMSFIVFTNLFGFIGSIISLPVTAIIKEVYLYYKKLYN